MLEWLTSQDSEVIKAFTLYIWSTILNEDSLKVCLVIVADTLGASMPSPLPPPVEKTALPGNTNYCIFVCIIMASEYSYLVLGHPAAEFF